MVATAAPVSVGHMLRDWRVRRRMSQLELATAAGISSRHLSFVETGRARPSREMVLHLAEYLDIPLRERNPLLIAAGYAPSYQATDLAAPEMQAVRAAIDRLLDGHEPYPAILIDRRWELVASNAAAMILVEGVAPELLEPPINVLRATLHPEGLAPRIANLGQWIDHILGSLRRQVAITGDDDLRALEDELAGYAEDMGVSADAAREAPGEVAIPMRLRTPSGELAFITMIATFGTALDITLSELSIETFLPADTATAELLHERAHPGSGHKLS
jgi:transcriptional regulator with XRE-family HTH domain